MDLFTQDDLKVLISGDRWPAVSLYMPTQPGGSRADPVLFRKLADQAHERLCQLGMRAPEARKLLAPLSQLHDDAEFWAHQCGGLALFVAPDFLRTYRLPWPFTTQFDVDNQFRVLPVLPVVEGDGRFFVLAISRNVVRLFQGSRWKIAPVDLKGVPRSLAEALLNHDTDEPLNFHTRPAGGIGSWGAIFHGQGVGIDDAKDDLLLYFQRVDRGLRAVLSHERAPLILAATEYQIPIFREACSYPGLQHQAILGNPDRLSEAELHDQAWRLVEPVFHQARRRALEGFEPSALRQRASADAEEVIPAALAGKVETLFVAADTWLWGRVSAESEGVTLHDQRQAGDVELLNRAAIGALAHDSAVHVVPAEMVPRGGAIAATFRVPTTSAAQGG